MDRRELMLIPIACLILLLATVAVGVAAASETVSYQKIDAHLAAKLNGQADDKIPVIVILNGEQTPDLDGCDVKYRYRLIHGLAASAEPSAIERLGESEFVQAVYYDGSAYLDTPENSSPGSDYISAAKGINADRLWEMGIDGKGVTVAVLDSGIDKNHPDLVGKVIGETNFVTDEATADDLLGHGTMVAGIVAGSGAASNGKYKGIAPGANLLNVKVINKEGDGKVSDIIAGIEWALYNGADVLSLSLGGVNLGETNPPITMAADNAADAGAVVCVAAGNRNNTEMGMQTDKSVEPAVAISQLGYSKKEDVYLLFVPIVLALKPGLIDSPGDGVKVITLGSSDNSGHVASFSGSGPTRDDRTKPDVVAPGVDIVGTVPPALEKPEYIDVYYARESGTSLSTPVAAGMAALLLQEEVNLTPAGVKAAMTRGAKKLNNSQGEEYEQYYQGTGLIDALSSHQLLGEDVSGVVPDKWIPGRWAYLPAGKGLYVGLDAGADRPQKKIYALAPGDDDWNTRFVFFSDSEKKDLRTTAKGSISSWISLQALPQRMDANSQQVFAASITVPPGTPPGNYSGIIEISDKDKPILTIPVEVQVAEELNITRGLGSVGSALSDSGWNYYYLDVPVGTSDIEASLAWDQSSPLDIPNLDLFLLAPTSEYYAAEEKGSLAERKNVQDPPSGRWLLAVHGENLSRPINYNLQLERSLVQTNPRRWNVESASPGTSSRAEFLVENGGSALENLSYMGVTENGSSVELDGSVAYKEVWEEFVNVTAGTKRLSARLNSKDLTNQSELLLVLENPSGEPADADLGSGDLGPLEITQPEQGSWKVKVYGYEVPDQGQSFSVLLRDYVEEPWTWILASGPTRIESDSSGTVEANLTIPANTSLHLVNGFIKIASANQTFQIPVSVTVAGTSLLGLTSKSFSDHNQDGYYESLNLGFGANVTAPDEYRLEGVLTDCSGQRIKLFDSSTRLQQSGPINISVNGSEIWKTGRCGPLRIENLILYDQSGNLIDRYKESITVDKDPKQFQPPVAYLLESFLNKTTTAKIAVGVNVSVIKPGNYQLSGTILDDEGEELGQDIVENDLEAGNATLVLEFNPTKFMMLHQNSQVHLVDLVLSLDGSELERRDEAWSSGEMDPEGFKSGLRSGRNMASSNGNSNVTGGTLRRENGTMVIS